MKIIFFGTSDVGLPILEALTQHHEIVHVVTSPDAAVGRKQEMRQSPIAEFASQASLPVSKPEKVKNNPEFIQFLKTLGADIFVVVSYGKILPPELLEIPSLKTVNVHFSLLPKYRGAAPIQYALLNNETVTGTTIFILDELVDHGPVLAKKEIAISPDDTFSTLAEKLSELSAQLIIDLLPKYQAGEITPLEQDHDSATFTKLIKKEHGQIDWSKTAVEIHNQWRGFTPWPGIWTIWNGQVMKILECEVAKQQPQSPEERDIVPCGNHTYLRLITVQLAGKKPMAMKEFLNGHPDFNPADLLNT